MAFTLCPIAMLYNLLPFLQPTHTVLALKDEGVCPCRHGGQHSSACRNLCRVAAAGCLDEGNVAQQAEGGGQDADGLRKRATKA